MYTNTDIMTKKGSTITALPDYGIGDWTDPYTRLHCKRQPAGGGHRATTSALQ